MTRTLLLALTILCAMEKSSLAGPILAHVRANGHLECGSLTEPKDYDKQDTHGQIEAFGEDVCRAVAAAVLGDASKVTVSGFPDEQEGMEAVRSGRIALFVGATPNPGLAARYGVVFGQPVFFDGQGFLVRKGSGIANLADLAGKTVCFIGGTDAELSLHRALDPLGIKFHPFPFEEMGEMEAALVTGHCRAQTGDVSALASGRTGFHGEASNFVVLPEQITLDPLSPVVAAGDTEWARIVDWTGFALITAETLGVTQANALTMSETGSDAIRTLLGTRRSEQGGLGLPNGWGLRVISATGNYGELFERDLGAQSPVGLHRGLNKPWTQGGLLWAPPFR